MNIKQQRTSEGSFLLAKDSEIYSWETKEIYKENTRRLYTVERILEMLRGHVCTVQIQMGPMGTTQGPRGSEVSCLADNGR